MKQESDVPMRREPEAMEFGRLAPSERRRLNFVESERAVRFYHSRYEVHDDLEYRLDAIISDFFKTVLLASEAF